MITAWTIGGSNVVSATLECPSQGAWWVDAITDGLPSSGVCVFGTATWRGAVVRTGLDGGQYRVRVVGGKGGLSNPMSGRELQGGVSARIAAEQIATAGGESIVAPGGAPFLRYQLYPETVGRAFDRLAARIGQRWYVDMGGVVRFDIGAPIDLPAPGDVVQTTATSRRYAVRSFDFLAPASIGGYLATHLRWKVSKDGAYLTALQDVAQAGDLDGVTRAPRLGRVTGQSGASVDVELDDGWAIAGVPLWVGLPGVTLSLANGVRVVVVWVSDDPSSPIALLCPAESQGSNSLEIAADNIELGKLGASLTLRARKAEVSTIPLTSMPVVRVGDLVTIVSDPVTATPVASGYIQSSVAFVTGQAAALTVGDGSIV